MNEIYAFLDTPMLIRSISKLSKRHRASLITKDSEVLKQRGCLKIDGKRLFDLFENEELDLEQFKKILNEESLNYPLSITNGIDITNSQVFF